MGGEPVLEGLASTFCPPSTESTKPTHSSAVSSNPKPTRLCQIYSILTDRKNQTMFRGPEPPPPLVGDIDFTKVPLRFLPGTNLVNALFDAIVADQQWKVELALKAMKDAGQADPSITPNFVRQRRTSSRMVAETALSLAIVQGRPGIVWCLLSNPDVDPELQPEGFTGEGLSPGWEPHASLSNFFRPVFSIPPSIPLRLSPGKFGHRRHLPPLQTAYQSQPSRQRRLKHARLCRRRPPGPLQLATTQKTG